MVKFTVPKPKVNYTPDFNTPRKEESEYKMNWLEWCSQNYQQVNKWAFINGSSSTTLYTVPTGYDLFITSSTISLSGLPTSLSAPAFSCILGDFAYIIYGNTIPTSLQNILNTVTLSAGSFVWTYAGSTQVSANNSNSVSFPCPIKVNQGQKIFLVDENGNDDGDSIITGSFNGFLVPRN